MESPEEHEQSRNSSVLEKGDYLSEGSSSEETMDMDQVNDASRTLFDGDSQLEPEGDSIPNDLESDEYSADSYGESDDEDLESEIDSMLEQGYPKSKRLEKPPTGTGGKKMASKAAKADDHNNELTIKKIVVLEEKDGNTFEVLPGGWIQVRHSSGMPLYLHRKSRVCTLAKPYYLGPGSVRRHSIPLSGIPCLSYRKALEKEQMDKELMEKQAKELENKVGDGSNEHQSDLTLLGTQVKPDDKLGEGKASTTKSETIAEKVNLLKRKLELGKGCSRQEKKGKVETNDPGNATEEKQRAEAKESTSKKDIAQLPSELENDNQEVSELNPSSGKTNDEKGSGPSPTKKEMKRFSKNGQKDQNLSGVRALIPLAKVETARENASLYSVAPLALRDYCAPLFKFTEVECKRFKTWSARRRHTKEQKRRQLERPILPDNAQVIKFFDRNKGTGGEDQMVKKFNDYVFNPNGKSSVCILHEFVQHALRKQPTYSFQELENAATPYSATVMINEIPYGRGYGSSKKTAKAEAAKATLEILIPQMKGQLNGNKADTSSDFDITQKERIHDVTSTKQPDSCPLSPCYQ